MSVLTVSVFGPSLLGAAAIGLEGGETFCLGGSVNFARTTFPSI